MIISLEFIEHHAITQSWILCSKLLLKGGSSYVTEHGDRPIFLSQFGENVYISTDLDKHLHCRSLEFGISKNRIQLIYDPGNTDIA